MEFNPFFPFISSWFHVYFIICIYVLDGCILFLVSLIWVSYGEGCHFGFIQLFFVQLFCVCLVWKIFMSSDSIPLLFSSFYLNFDVIYLCSTCSVSIYSFQIYHHKILYLFIYFCYHYLFLHISTKNAHFTYSIIKYFFFTYFTKECSFYILYHEILILHVSPHIFRYFLGYCIFFAFPLLFIFNFYYLLFIIICYC